MTELGNQLMQLAVEVSNDFRQKKHQLERELGKVQLQLTQIQASLDHTDLAIDRINSFQPESGGILICPYCWLANEQKNEMVPQQSGSSLDIFKCRECHQEFSV